MSRLCRWFGHKHGWGKEAPYGEVDYYTTDNIGRTHFHVNRRCVRCHKWFTVARFHGSQSLADRINSPFKERV